MQRVIQRHSEREMGFREIWTRKWREDDLRCFHLLQELGEPKRIPQLLVEAVVTNNKALECLSSVSPNPPGRRARRTNSGMASSGASSLNGNGQ